MFNFHKFKWWCVETQIYFFICKDLVPTIQRKTCICITCLRNRNSAVGIVARLWSGRARFVSILHLRETSRPTVSIISPRTEWVPGVKRPGREADRVSEWIYTSAPPICRRGVHRSSFTLIFDYMLTTKQLIFFMEKTAVYCENRIGREYWCFKY